MVDVISLFLFFSSFFSSLLFSSILFSFFFFDLGGRLNSSFEGSFREKNLKQLFLSLEKKRWKEKKNVVTFFSFFSFLFVFYVLKKKLATVGKIFSGKKKFNIYQKKIRKSNAEIKTIKVEKSKKKFSP